MNKDSRISSRSNLISRLRYFANYGRQAAANGELPLIRQWLEILGLYILGGNGPGYYYMGGFQRRSMHWEDKIAHLGERTYLRTVRRLNAPQYNKLSQHKLSEKAILTLMGVPTPRFLGYFDFHTGRTFRNEPLTNQDQLSIFLSSIGTKRFCIKRAEGSGGVGFRAYETTEMPGVLQLRSLADGQSITSDDLYALLESDVNATRSGLMIEEYLTQHSDVATFSQASVNSVRLWVLIDRNERVSYPLAFLRMGRGRSLVDNRSRGGLVAPIDIRTGILSAALDGYPSREEFARHPDTGALIAGRTLPYWPEALGVAEQAIRIFPGIRFAGIDIAFADYGPVVLELNVEPDRTGAAITGVPSGKVLRS